MPFSLIGIAWWEEGRKSAPTPNGRVHAKKRKKKIGGKRWGEGGEK